MFFFAVAGLAGAGFGGKWLKGQKIGEGAGELAIEDDLIAKQSFVWAGILPRAEQSQESADGFGPDGPILESSIKIQGVFLRLPDARLTPASHRHGLYQRDLRRGARAVFVHESREEFLKAVRGFVLQDDGLS
jgi:hypothetical protein